MIKPLHPPLNFKHSFSDSIAPLPLLHSTQFSSQKNMLDPARESPDADVHFPAGLERRFSDSLISYDATNYGVRAQKTAQNYQSWNIMGAMSGEETLLGEGSGVGTPPLWRTSPSSSPQHRYNNYRCMSPASKAQAIARGQRELMEMVSRMPESCYELSLKDLVEHPMVLEAKKESFIEERSLIDEEKQKREKAKKKKNDQRPKIRRSSSIDNNRGLFLKMVFPVYMGSYKSKKKNDSPRNTINSKVAIATNNHSKVSPKPPALEASANKGEDKEWWKKRFAASSGSESCGSSTNSRSTKSSGSSSIGSSRSNSSNRNERSGGCCLFIRGSKKRTAFP